MSKGCKTPGGWRKACAGLAVAAAAAGLEHMTVPQPQPAPPACVQITNPVPQQLT
jgi:hypothetical protein